MRLLLLTKNPFPRRIVDQTQSALGLTRLQPARRNLRNPESRCFPLDLSQNVLRVESNPLPLPRRLGKFVEDPRTRGSAIASRCYIVVSYTGLVKLCASWYGVIPAVILVSGRREYVDTYD